MLGDRLRKEREKKGITQSDAAKSLNISASTVGMYEQGRRDPDTSMLKKFADLYNVTTDYLLGREDQQEYKIEMPEFPYLAKEYPNMDINQYIYDIREAIGMAVKDGKIKPEQVEELVQQTVRYLLFQIEDLKNKNK